MLHDLDETLENLIRKEGQIPKGDIDISFEQPTGEWSARLNRPTLSCWCFDLRENVKLRGTERQVTRNGLRATTSFPPRRIDLSYLVTAWARKIEDEHQLLWRALAVLKRFPLIPLEETMGMLRSQTRDIPLFVADMSNNAINLVDLWSVMDNEMRLGFLVVATVELDVEMGFEGPLVLETGIRVGQMDDPDAREPQLTGEYLEIQHKGDIGKLEDSGERSVSTKRAVKRVEEDGDGADT